MTPTREHELWGMALWVERTQGEAGRLYIAEQQDRHLAAGNTNGVLLWRAVGDRFERLREAEAFEAN